MSFAQPFADYVILSRIGAGAMGTVFKARHKKLNRIVALKVLRPSLARDTHYVDRLRREARIVASLNHPNIVAGYDLGEEGGYHFFVMEYFEGASLRTLLSEWGMFPEEQVLDTAIQIVDALDHAYRKDVIHRDIKPGNILIGERGDVKLTDMGLAKGPADLTLTRDGATVGTPQYISPEQARNPQQVDIRSDLYSLGATLYHMATGQTPFVGDTMAEVITKVLHERAASATDLNPKLSDGLSLVIRKLMAKNPDLRYQTPGELLDDLRRVQREETPDIDLDSLEAAETPPRPPRTPRRRIAAGAAFAAVAAISIWIGSIVSSGADDSSLTAEEFEQHLEQKLAAAAELPEGLRFRERLRVLSAEKDLAGSGEFRDIVARREEREMSVLKGRMDTALRNYLDENGEGLRSRVNDPDQWRRDVDSTARDFALALAPELEKQFGFDRWTGEGELDAMADVREQVREFVDERNQRYLGELDSYLQVGTQEGSEYRDRLEEPDFAGAQQALRRLATGFFERPGRPHSPDHLPDGLREKVDRRLGEAVETAQGVIDAEEQRIAADLTGKAAEALRQIKAELDSGDAPIPGLLVQLDSLVVDLRQHFPGGDAFRTGADPWSTLNWEVSSLRRKLKRPMQEERVAGRLSLAYSTLVVQGDFRTARAWLDFDIEAEDLEQMVDKHRVIMTAAEAVSRAILETLVEVPGRLRVRRIADSSRELDLVIERQGEDEFRVRALLPGGSEIAGSLVELQFTDLLEQARVRAPDLLDGIPHADAGLALCLFVSNQYVAAQESLRPEDREFFVDQVWPPLRVAFEARSQVLAGEGNQALEDLLNARLRAEEDDRIADLRRALDELRDRFPEVEGENEQVIADIEEWLLGAEKRRVLADEIRARSLPGAEIAVDEDLHGTVTYPLTVLREIELPRGWSAAEDALEFGLVDVPLSRAHPLSLKGLALPEDRDFVFTTRLRFPPGKDSPWLSLFECDGIGLVLGLLANNAVVPAFVELKDIRDPDDLRDALQGPLADAAEKPAAYVIPGAVHELTFRVSPVAFNNTRLDVTVLLDGVELTKGRRRAGRRGLVAIVPMQPLSLVQVRLEGDFR